MKIEYRDWPDQQDPAELIIRPNRHYLNIQFDSTEELTALRACTPERILDYTRHAMTAFLEENANAH